jgi:pre-mRNA-splicing factor CWC22
MEQQALNLIILSTRQNLPPNLQHSPALDHLSIASDALHELMPFATSASRLKRLAPRRRPGCARGMSAEPGRGRSSRFAPAATTEPLYLPPHKVAALHLSAVSRKDRQRLAWERLRKRIHGVVNRANASNAADCAVELLQLNLVRGMGLLCRSLLRAQVVSQNFSPAYAAVVCALNARLPELGQVLLARIISQLKRGMDASDRGVCVASVKFVAHLYNQSVVDALLPLEIMHILASAQSNDSMELLVVFIKECGALLADSEPRMLDELFQVLRTVVQEGEVDTRIQYLVEGLMTLRRSSFKGYESLPNELDLIPDEDRIIHNASFSGDDDGMLPELDAFAFDDDWEESELRYAEFRLQVLGEDDSLLFEDAPEVADSVDDGGGDARDDDSAPNNLTTSAVTQERAEAKQADMTEDELVTFRRKVYLQIMSAVGYEECAHKLAQFMRSHRGNEGELCNMILECCSQERTFMRYYGLVGKQFCLLNKVYVARFEEAFAEHYATIHQFDSRKIRNMANFYAFLLCSDVLPWSIFSVAVLSEDETTSSSRIFLKYILLELSQTLTLGEVGRRFADERLKRYVSGLFPSTIPANMRFAINFFTAIGLGPLTDGMRAQLRELPLQNAATAIAQKGEDEQSSSSSSSLSSSSSSDLSSSSAGADMDDRRNEMSGRKRPQSHILSEDASPSRRTKYARHGLEQDGRGRLPSDRRNVRPDGFDDDHGRDGYRVPGRGDANVLERDDLAPGALRGRGRGRGEDLTIPAWVKEARQRASAARDDSGLPIPPPPPPRADKGQPRAAAHARDRSPMRSRSRSASESPPPRSARQTPPRYRDRSTSRERSLVRRVGASPPRRRDSRSPGRYVGDRYRSPPRGSRYVDGSDMRYHSRQRKPSPDDSWKRNADRGGRRGGRSISRSRSPLRSPAGDDLRGSPRRERSRSPRHHTRGGSHGDRWDNDRYVARDNERYRREYERTGGKTGRADFPAYDREEDRRGGRGDGRGRSWELANANRLEFRADDRRDGRARDREQQFSEDHRGRGDHGAR